jgi:large conductance mechanosensitive channel
MRSLANDFKQFLLRGNLIDLAVAIVVGVAFGDVVKALVSDFITPLIAAIGGEPDFGDLAFEINNSTFAYGHFINTLLSFIIIAAVIFFFVIKPVNYMIERSHREPPPDPTMRKCPECLSDIPVAARRCSHCTSEVAAG